MDRKMLEMERLFLALSDGTRLRLLGLMNGREVSVGYLSDELGQSQPKISRHLAYLRSADLVRTRRDGKWIYYSIDWPADGRAAKVVASALNWIGGGGGTDIEENPHDDYRPYPSAGEETVVGEETGPDCNDIEIFLL
jgi:DNA-binding transcriptional ArsR family regulator